MDKAKLSIKSEYDISKIQNFKEKIIYVSIDQPTISI